MNNCTVVAFYLPQFHPIPENDEWWGTGFTEWSNVVRGVPRFPGHYQPHLPGELGFYDLRVPEVREAQAALAREHGIGAFCYYHYWFHGKQLLDRPFRDVLESGKPEFPFCLCWANESWSRAWDGNDREVLIGQTYSREDDVQHIRHLLRAFADPRYLRIGGKPVFLVYRAGRLPEPRATTDLWRREAARAGFELYLCSVHSFSDERQDPRELGFDATVEFAPDWRAQGPRLNRGRISGLLVKLGMRSEAYLHNSVRSYVELVRQMQAKPRPSYPFFRCVSPGFDNSARRPHGAAIFVGSTPEVYGRWLRWAVTEVASVPSSHPRLVFMNAWNEWAEGNHLEPDARHGRAYLVATRQAVAHAAQQRAGEIDVPAPA